MKLEDIRLTDDEVMSEVVIYSGHCTTVKLAMAISKAATDKAIRKIVEALQPDRRCSHNSTCYDCMEAIKKLVKGGG